MKRKLYRCKICDCEHPKDECPLPVYYIKWLSKFPPISHNFSLQKFWEKYYGPNKVNPALEKYSKEELDNMSLAVRKAIMAK